MSEAKTLTVYYDGLCHLCSREIDHYRKLNGSEKIHFVDITSAEFDAKAQGLDPQAVHQELHARSEDGKIYVGVEAFVQIWSRLDSFKWIVPFARSGPVYTLLKLGYRIFVRIRPLLPRKSCAASPYCATGKKE